MLKNKNKIHALRKTPQGFLGLFVMLLWYFVKVHDTMVQK